MIRFMSCGEIAEYLGVTLATARAVQVIPTARRDDRPQPRLDRRPSTSGSSPARHELNRKAPTVRVGLSSFQWGVATNSVCGVCSELGLLRCVALKLQLLDQSGLGERRHIGVLLGAQCGLL